jgi:hypothetical protein
MQPKKTHSSHRSIVVGTTLAVLLSSTVAQAQPTGNGGAARIESDETGLVADPSLDQGRFVVVEESEDDAAMPPPPSDGYYEDASAPADRGGPSQRTIGFALTIAGLGIGLAGGAMAIAGSSANDEGTLIAASVIGLTGSAMALTGFIVSATADSATGPRAPFVLAIAPNGLSLAAEF